MDDEIEQKLITRMTGRTYSMVVLSNKSLSFFLHDSFNIYCRQSIH